MDVTVLDDIGMCDEDFELLAPSFMNDNIVVLETDDEENIGEDDESVDGNVGLENILFHGDDTTHKFHEDGILKEIFTGNILPPNKCLIPFFPPPPPKEIVELFIRRCKGGFVKGIPDQIASSPYKYVIKVLTTLPKLKLGSSNDRIKVVEEKREMTKFSDCKNEFFITVQFSADRVPFSHDRAYDEFELVVFDGDNKCHFISNKTTLNSNQTSEEKYFWRMMDRESKKRKRDPENGICVLDFNNRKPRKKRKLF